MRDILISTTIIASFIGGVVALFAPCCISVMLPAYFANTFRRRRELVAMTFVFALGVASVILPIAFGASALTRFIIGRHTLVFLIGAAMMVALGLAMVFGWRMPIPMPGMQAQRRRGPLSVLALGAFSGAASACCAPVLAGVVALAGAAGSFTAATAIGVAYVFGMVAPLFAMALLWDRFDWGDSRLIKGRMFHLQILGRRWAVHSTALIGGSLLIAMGGLTAVLGISGVAMPREGWQASLSADLQHYGDVTVNALSGIPGWVSAAAVFAALALLARKALRDHLDGIDGDTEPDPDDVANPKAAADELVLSVPPKGDQ